MGGRGWRAAHLMKIGNRVQKLGCAGVGNGNSFFFRYFSKVCDKGSRGTPEQQKESRAGKIKFVGAGGRGRAHFSCSRSPSIYRTIYLPLRRQSWGKNFFFPNPCPNISPPLPSNPVQTSEGRAFRRVRAAGRGVMSRGTDGDLT